jgi:hypothetical protein
MDLLSWPHADVPLAPRIAMDGVSWMKVMAVRIRESILGVATDSA